MALCSPRTDPSQAGTGKAHGAAVTGCRIVKVAATWASGIAVPIAHCGAADVPYGCAANDTAQNGHTAVYFRQEVPIEAGGTGVTAGAAVEVMADGKVQTFSAGTKVGVAVSTGASGTFPMIHLQL